MNLFNVDAPIIDSLMQDDLYKWSMDQCILHRFPGVSVKVKFKCRTPNVDLRPLIPEINENLDYLCNLHFQKEDLEYLAKIRWFKPDFIDYLRMLQLDRNQIHVEEDESEPCKIRIWAEGAWRTVIWFEIPVLAIVQELYMRHYCKDNNIDLLKLEDEGKRRLDSMIRTFGFNADLGFKLSDFGIRRRFSGPWQDYVVQQFSEQIPNVFSGTSNVALAKKYNVLPIGTFAHELFMGIAGTNVKTSEIQKATLQAWANEYRGDLGIALSDIYGFRAFLRDFDLYFAKLFDGCRHDSGDPITWGEMLIDHYKKLRIDPTTKTGVWSDSLDENKAIEIAKHFKGRIKVSFGIGTRLCNNLGIEPLSIVMKLIESNGNPVCKLSDCEEKQMCEDQTTVNWFKHVYQWKPID